MTTSKIAPFLWFDNELGEAMELYSSIFKDAKVTNRQYTSEGKLFVAEFELAGQKFMAMNAGPHAEFTEAISFHVECKDQAEVDEYWEKFLASGGKESMCGWLEDKYGISWQIIPKDLYGFVFSENTEKAKKATEAMYTMRKIDLSKIEKAYNNA